MSQPSFPTSPPITRDDAINQILSSIAMEELGLSHVINAEGEKLQYILGTIPGITGPASTIEDVLQANDSVRTLLESAAQNQLFFKSKMQSALSASLMAGPTGATGATGATGPSGGPTGATAALIYAQLHKPFICKGLDHTTKIKLNRITTPKTLSSRLSV